MKRRSLRMPEMRHRLDNPRGQLLLPMLVLIILFVTFFALYLRWCRQMYWQMRMDITAEAVALSAARAQAGMLNNLATLQTAGNVFIQKAKILSNNVGVVQLSMRNGFELYHDAVHLFLNGYLPYTIMVANQVAKANRADNLVIPWPRPQSRLMPQSVTVDYMYGFWPTPLIVHYDNVYYARSWRDDLKNPQPIHVNAWAVKHQGIVGVASARLWLDVNPADPQANGGFPRLNGSMWEGLGIQCLYPHFNARLAPTSILTRLALTRLAKGIS